MAKLRAKSHKSTPAPKTATKPSDRGDGGELHQTASSPSDTLTTQQGIPVADDQNSLKQGARGPTLLEDAHFRERFSTSTMSVYPSGWFMPVVMPPTASLN